MWYCVWLDHQQTSNHICIEMAYGRGRPIDSDYYCVYRRWRWTVKMQASVNILDVKKSGNVSPDVYVTATLCEDWNKPTSRSFATHPYMTGITKWFERLAFIEYSYELRKNLPKGKKSSLAWTLIINLFNCNCYCYYIQGNACRPKLGWQCRFLRIIPASRMS